MMEINDQIAVDSYEVQPVMANEIVAGVPDWLVLGVGVLIIAGIVAKAKYCWFNSVGRMPGWCLMGGFGGSTNIRFG